jgi:hypothetical protein
MLEQFLKTQNARLSCDNRWLVWEYDQWTVYEQPRGRRVQQVTSTEDMEAAIAALKNDTDA